MCALSEEDLASLLGLLGFVTDGAPAPFATEGKSPPNSRAGANPLKPVLQEWEIFKPLALVLIGYDPAPAGHISNRVASSKIVPVLQALVHHAIEPVRLVGIPLDCIGYLVLGVLTEVMGLARHRTKPSHLPEQPLVNLNSRPLGGRIEPASLASEILKDSPRLEDRDRFAAWPFRIHDGGHPVVRCDLQKGSLELVTNSDIHRPDRIGQPALLQHDRNLPAIWRWPIVEVDRVSLAPHQCGTRPCRVARPGCLCGGWPALIGHSAYSGGFRASCGLALRSRLAGRRLANRRRALGRCLLGSGLASSRRLASRGLLGGRLASGRGLLRRRLAGRRLLGGRLLGCCLADSRLL